MDFIKNFNLTININDQCISTPYLPDQNFKLVYLQQDDPVRYPIEEKNIIYNIILNDPIYSKMSKDFGQKDYDFLRNLYPGGVETPSTVPSANVFKNIPPSISALVQDFSHVFSCKPGDAKTQYHQINLEHDRPINLRPYRSSPAKRAEVEKLVQEMLDGNIIQKSYSAYASPVVLVERKESTDTNKKFRFCIDYRKLNDITIKETYPLPRIDDSLEFLAKKPFLSVLDARLGYWNVRVDPKDIPKTAFITHNGKFEFLRMPFGLCNAPYTFMRVMQDVLGHLIGKSCVVYLDDIIVASSTLEQHAEDLKNIFQSLQDVGLTLNVDKCHFCVSELVILGHLVTPQGIKPNPKKTEAISKYPTPASITDVQRFLGLAGYYRRFIPNYSTIAKPLTSLLKKNIKFIWSEKCKDSFNLIKSKLISEPILSFPDFSKEFILTTDASDFGVGATLSQSPNETGAGVIAYASRTLSTAEEKWSTPEKECLGIIFGIEHFRPYLEGMKFTVMTDHNALCWLKSIKDPHGRLARWSLRLQNLNYTVKHQPGKTNQVADALSRAPLPVSDWPDTGNRLLVITSTPNTDDTNITNTSVSTLLDSADTNNLDSFLNNTYIELRKLQEEDPDIAKLLALIADNNLIVDKKTKNFFEKNKDYLVFFHNVLYFKRKKLKLEHIERRYRLLLPKALVVKVLKNFHDSPLGGHMGVYKTYHRISARYQWTGMRKTITDYVRSCSTCQLMKSSSSKPIGKMETVQATRPMQYVALDYIGPLPRTVTGSKYCIIFLDLFTKWVECFPIREATARLAIEKLMEVISRHGVPEILISDRGTQFTSGEFGEALDSLNIKHHKTSIHHPESNQVERSIRTVKSLIRCYLEGRHNTWDKYLNEILFAIRSAPQESTGESPGYLVYGRDMHFPIDNEYHCPDILNEDTIDFDRATLNERFSLLHRLANMRLNKSHVSQEKYYSRRRREHTFRVGDLVKVSDFTPSSKIKGVAAKLSPRYKGPFRIHKHVKQNNYELKYMHSDNIFGVRHVQQILPYYNRPRELSWDIAEVELPQDPVMVQQNETEDMTNPTVSSETNATVGSQDLSSINSTPSYDSSFMDRVFGPTKTDESSLSSK